VWHNTPVVAIFDTNDDLVELLRLAFEQAGLIVVTAHIHDLRRGTLDLINFVRQHNPDVIVYDVTPPYEAHWRFLQHTREAPDMIGRQFIITSVNAQQVYENVGTREPIFEIVGKPYDVEQITRDVKEASRAGSMNLPAESVRPSSTAQAHDRESPRPGRRRKRTHLTRRKGSEGV
jgi:DNA-binding NtrC family response regulator